MQTAHLWATSRNLPFTANLDIIENPQQLFQEPRVGTPSGYFWVYSQNVNRNPRSVELFSQLDIS